MSCIYLSVDVVDVVVVVVVDDVEESDCGANCRSVFSIELN